MTKEDKQLLLVDLCARLPHHPHIWINEHLTNVELTPDSEVYQYVVCEDCKPYLRPLSSMTEEEINEFILISDTTLWLGNKRSTCILSLEQMDWLNKKMFDYRNLILMGLALKAKEGMYETKV